MPHIIKTPEAEKDLENIWLYSFQKWNEEQADNYYDELINGVENLIANPMLGKPREHIRSGYRSILINRHVIYYRIEGEAINMIRVLHERMTPKKHL